MLELKNSEALNVSLVGDSKGYILLNLLNYIHYIQNRNTVQQQRLSCIKKYLWDQNCKCLQCL